MPFKVLSDRVTIKVKALLVSAALPETIFCTERLPVANCTKFFVFVKDADTVWFSIMLPLAFCASTVYPSLSLSVTV